MQRIYAEAVVEVSAEIAIAYFCCQVAVGGCYQAHIHPVFAVRAQALQLAALQHAQQLGLHRQWQLTDFVEEQGAAIGQFELAAALAMGTGEGTAHMAEQFAFHQGIGQGGTVEADQRFVGAVAGLVQGLGHQLLADTGLTGDKHGQVAATDQADFLHQALVRGALTNQLFVLAAGLAVDLRAVVFVFRAQGQVLDALGHGDRGGGQAGEGLQGTQLQALELPGGEGIEGNQAPRALIDHQRAAHAVMYFQVGIGGVDQAVVRVGQLRVAGEAGWFRAAEQYLEAWVLADPEAPAQGIGAQAVHCQRHQPLAVQAQQSGGIAGQ